MTDATRLSEAMDRRRLDLRLKWTQVAERADLSQAGLGAIRRGERSPSALTRVRIEHALRWAPGSVDAVLAGGDPTVLETSEIGGATAQELRRLIAETEDELRSLNPKYESNRQPLAAHLQRRLDDLRRQLDTVLDR